MVDSIKVALISHEGGGISSVCHGLAKSLAKKKIHTTIFTSNSTRSCEKEKTSDYLEIIRLPILNVPPRSLWFQILNLRTLSRQLKSYTVVHGVSPDASFILAQYKKKLNKPFIATIHGTPRAIQKVFVNSPISSWTLGDFGYNILEFPLHDFTINKILSCSDHTAVCSFATLEELRTYRSLDLNNVSVIYNGIDFDEIENIKAPSNNNIDSLSIVYAGRLFWTKGAMHLLKAFRNIRKNFLNVHLKIFGKGPLEQRIKQYIHDSGLSNHVSFLGHVSHERLLGEVKMTDVVALPSLYEAQPMFALEAMACKKPLVVFDAPYTRELISNINNGLLAQMCNIKDLSDKIQTLLSDRTLRERIGENAYNYVKQKHNWDIQTEKYLKLYEDATRYPRNSSLTS